MTDVNEIAAGIYVLVALRWDEITSKPNEPLDFVRHVYGDEVDLSKAEARRLVLAGAVVKPADYEKAVKGEVPGSEQSVAPGEDADPDAGKATAKPPTIDDLMKDVGTDKAKAQVALDEENAQETPRKTYVAKLQAVLDAE